MTERTTMEPKFTKAPCPRCGSPERVVNPAWLRQRRKRAGVQLRELARRAEFSAAFICDVEHGRRNCLPPLLKIYEALTP